MSLANALFREVKNAVMVNQDELLGKKIVWSILDEEDGETEFVIVEYDDYTCVTRYNFTLEKGLEKDWHIYGRTGQDVYDCLEADEIIKEETCNRQVMTNYLYDISDSFAHYQEGECVHSTHKKEEKL